MMTVANNSQDNTYHKLALRYHRSKNFAIISSTAWLLAILLLGLNQLFSFDVLFSTAVALAIVALTAIATYRSWILENRRWKPLPSCNSSQQCSRSECSGATGSCSAKVQIALDNELFLMETERLRLMLRRRFGYDLIFFLLWLIISVLVFTQSTSQATRVLATFLFIGTTGVIIARIMISKIAFGATR